MTNPIVEIATVLAKAAKANATVFVIGNGGSAANATHFVCDMRQFRAISLCTNTPLILAIGNDVGFDSIFSEQIKSLARQGDVVVAISGSGNSPNILKAVKYANGIGCITIGLCGFDGGKLKLIVDYCLHVDVCDMQRVEDIHAESLHLIARELQ